MADWTEQRENKYLRLVGKSLPGTFVNLFLGFLGMFNVWVLPKVRGEEWVPWVCGACIACSIFLFQDALRGWMYRYPGWRKHQASKRRRWED